MNRKDFLATLGTGALGANALAAATTTPTVAAPAATPPPMPALTDLLCLDDVEKAAHALMPPPVRDFIAGGAADELTLR